MLIQILDLTNDVMNYYLFKTTNQVLPDSGSLDGDGSLSGSDEKNYCKIKFNSYAKKN